MLTILVRRYIAGAALLGAMGLAACSQTPDPVSSTLAGEPQNGRVLAQGEDADAVAQPVQTTAPNTTGLTLNNTVFQPVEITLGPPTGTEVGRRIEQLRQDLSQLQSSIAANNGQLQSIREGAILSAQTYNGLVAAIRARLQIGTTPGNPILVSQLSEAQLALEDIAGQVARMSSLSGQSASDSSLAGFILDSVEATFDLSGAVDEDHRQLTILQDETRRTVVLIDRILLEVAEDIGRQNSYVANERRDLQTLQLAVSNGEFYGTNLAGISSQAAGQSIAVQQASAPAPGARPLVVIRFNDPSVAYEQPVYDAVSAALDARPGAVFAITAMSPAIGDQTTVALAANQARDSAADVRRTLVSMGLPAGRMILTADSNRSVSGSEVHIFVQ